MSNKIIAQLRQDNDRLRAAVKLAQQRAKDLRAELDKRVTPVESKTAQLKVRDKNQSAKIEALKADLAEAKKQNKVLDRARTECEKELASLQKEKQAVAEA